MTDKPTPPTPAELDTLAEEYNAAREMYLQSTLATKDLQQQMELRADKLKEAVKLFGQQYAEKSKLLHGVKFEIMCSYAQTSAIDAVAVEQFRGELQKAKQTRLLGKMFEKSVRYTLRSQASEIVRGEKLTAKLRSLWARCIVLKDIAPKLTVREKEKAA